MSKKEIINQVCEIVGYDTDRAGGTIPSGGSMSNMMAMIMARDAYDLNIRAEGNPGKMIAYTSKESHYSVPKNAALVGIGRRNVRFIKADEKGKMIPELLENQIQKDLEAGFVPFFVNATAGTTVMGAFDPIQELSLICKKFDLWLHVDGAYCGSVIFSEKYKHLVNGLEEADSFSVNAHKMLNTPLTCSIVIAKDKKHLYNSFSNDAEYLYQTGDDDNNFGKNILAMWP